MSALFSLRRAAAVANVESKQLTRDRSALMLIFLLPVMQLLLYGYAVNLFPEHTRLAVSGNAAYARQALDWARTSSAFNPIGPVGAPGASLKAVQSGQASIGLDISTGAPGLNRARLFADGSDPATARPALAALQEGLWRTAAASDPDMDPVPDITWLFNPAHKDSWSVVPGLVGVIVMVSMLFLGAMTLVRERERGSWESLLATPVRPSEALAGKLAPYLVIGVVETLFLLGVIHLLFGIPLPPATWALVAAAPLFSSSYLILGFAFSALAQNQLQAVQGAVGVYLPSLLLSGFLFPFQGMPAWARYFGEMMPITHYLRATRAILLRGEPASAMLPQMVPILIFVAVAFALSVLAYRRRLD
jgi:ABC-2 type transport system permease protein